LTLTEFLKALSLMLKSKVRALHFLSCSSARLSCFDFSMWAGRLQRNRQLEQPATMGLPPKLVGIGFAGDGCSMGFRQ